jgi:hypothetical protein
MAKEPTDKRLAAQAFRQSAQPKITAEGPPPITTREEAEAEFAALAKEWPDYQAAVADARRARATAESILERCGMRGDRLRAYFEKADVDLEPNSEPLLFSSGEYAVTQSDRESVFLTGNIGQAVAEAVRRRVFRKFIRITFDLHKNEVKRSQNRPIARLFKSLKIVLERQVEFRVPGTTLVLAYSLDDPKAKWKPYDPTQKNDEEKS